MSRFHPDPHTFFENAYREIPPWEIGRPQPDLLALLREFPPAGPVLDVGCGAGDLSIHLAGSGLQVVGVDLIEAAVERARRKGARLDPEVRERLDFRVGDAARPSRLGMSFGAVVDSAFLHVLDSEARAAFAADLEAVVRPGGRYYLLEFGVEIPGDDSPLPVTPEELNALFDPAGWRRLAVREGTIESSIRPIPALAACLERAAGP